MEALSAAYCLPPWITFHAYGGCVKFAIYIYMCVCVCVCVCLKGGKTLVGLLNQSTKNGLIRVGRANYLIKEYEMLICPCSKPYKWGYNDKIVIYTRFASM